MFPGKRKLITEVREDQVCFQPNVTVTKDPSKVSEQLKKTYP